MNIDMLWDESPVDVTAEANFIWSIANKLRGSYMPCLLYTSIFFTFFHTSGIDNLCRLTSGECIINNTGCPL